MKEGQQGEATDWWSPVSRQKRGMVSWGRERDKCWKSCLLRWLKGLWSWQKIWCTRSARCFCRLQLVCRFNASFLCVLIQIMCKRKNMHTHTQNQQLFSPSLACVFIKESSCSIVLRSNGDWLWHNYTNPCMNLVLMEAEHLTQTKCRRADQWTGHLHMQCISFKDNHKSPGRLGTSQVGDTLLGFRNEDACLKNRPVRGIYSGVRASSDTCNRTLLRAWTQPVSG